MGAEQAGGFSTLILTLNEEVHLPSCLAALKGVCDDVVVVDSFSTDRTAEIASAQGARFYQNRFLGFGQQRSWALENIALKHDWVLILDADERVPPALAQELSRIAVESPAEFAAFQVRRRFHMWGRWLRYSSLYPSWVVRFFHRSRIRYMDRGHAETQELTGRLGSLQNDLIDENLKGIDEWFERQNRYSRKEAEYELRQQDWRLLDLLAPDALKRRAALKQLSSSIPFRPALYFLYSYVFRLGFLDGRDGLVFCTMRATYQAMIVAKKYDARRAPQVAHKDE